MDTAEKFNRSFVRDASGCWLWARSTTQSGYGRIRVGSKTKRAHRVSFELHVGELGDDDVVCHRCDTPACVNPGHLFLGTHADNVRDMVRKGRSVKGERVGTSKLSASDVIKIRKMCEAREVSQSAVGRLFGVSQECVSSVFLRRSWKHIQ